MPEIPEIHSFATSVNEWASNLAITSIHRGSKPKGPDFSFSLPLAPWNIFALARGKELSIDIKSAAAAIAAKPGAKVDTVTVTFTHGLVGQWQRHPRSAIPNFCQLAFLTADDAICFVDSMRMGSWRVGGFDTKRGPDPIDHHSAFVKRIKSSLSKPAFTKPICEVLLNQDYFNGIGNYLRAEILYRARVMPFESARAVLSDTLRGDRLLSLCHTIPCEVINLKLNKYGTAVEKQRFLQWLQCYEKGTFSTDSAGRKIYFFDKQNELPFDSTTPTPKLDDDAATATGVAAPPKIQTSSSSPIKAAATSSNNTEAHMKAAMSHRPRESPPPQKDLTRMLMIISVLFKTNRISSAQRATLKDHALLGNDVAFSILEAFLADENKDWDELTDSFSRFCTISSTA